MGDLLQSYVSGKPLAKPPAAVVAAAMMARPPPVPEKDYHSVRSTAASHRQHSPAPAPTQPPAPRAGPGRPLKRSRYACLHLRLLPTHLRLTRRQ